MFKKGCIPWNKGKTGVQIAWNKGIPHPEKTKEKMKRAKIGYIPWIKGKHHTEATKIKMKAKAKGRIPWNKGKKMPELSEKYKSKGNPMYGKPSWNRGLKGYLGKEKHYNWKGGITVLTTQIRECFKYRQWRSDVFTRDNFTCQNCGDDQGRNLVAHHIKQFNEILEKYQIKTLKEALSCEELWNINNGQTLCEKCHIKIHARIYAKRP